MLSNPLIAFANSYNMQIEDNYAFGVIDGFLVSVYNTGSKKTAFISCCFPTENDEAEEENSINSFQFSSEINKLVDSGVSALSDYELTSDSVAFYTSEELKAFDAAVIEIIKLLHNNHIHGVDMCIDCGKASGEEAKFVVENTNAHTMCKECAEEYVQKISEDNSKNAKPKYLRGSLSTCLGGALGAIISFLCFCFIIPTDGILGFKSSLVAFVPLAAVISVLAFLFYRIFTGRKKLERIIPCLIASALFTAIGVYASTAVVYAKSLGITTFNDARPVISIIAKAPFNDPSFNSDFLSHLFYSMVIVIIVALIYSIIFEDKNKKTIKIMPFNKNNDKTECNTQNELDTNKDE